MLRTILKYGVIAGLIVGGLEGVTVATFSGMPPLKYGMWIGYTTMLIALSAVFVGIKRHRDVDRGGVIGFWRAFGIGVGISFIAGIFYVVAWEVVQAATHMDFATSYSRAVIAGAKAKGASAEVLAKLTADMEHFRAQYADPMFRLPMTFIEIFPVGVLVSLISAALLRTSRFLPARRA
jgi:ABC-type multidrug transport system fused ATPase/permease subunit